MDEVVVGDLEWFADDGEELDGLVGGGEGGGLEGELLFARDSLLWDGLAQIHMLRHHPQPAIRHLLTLTLFIQLQLLQVIKLRLPLCFKHSALQCLLLTLGELQLEVAGL